MLTIIWISIKSFIGKAIDIFTRYPMQIILVLVCCYAFWQKSRYDAIVSDYSKYKAAAEQLAKDKEHENEILRNYAKLLLDDAQSIYDNNLKAIKNEYLKKQKLDSITINDLRNRLREQIRTDSFTMPETPADTETNTEVWRERYSKLVGQYETLKYGCAITTADFNVCRDWIDISCLQVGCE